MKKEAESILPYFDYKKGIKYNNDFRNIPDLQSIAKKCYELNEQKMAIQARGDRYIDSLSLIVNNATTSPDYISHQCLQRHTAWREQATWSLALSRLTGVPYSIVQRAKSGSFLCSEVVCEPLPDDDDYETYLDCTEYEKSPEY